MDREWVMCPCKMCKHQKRRLRHVMDVHVVKHGKFELSFEELVAHVQNPQGGTTSHNTQVSNSIDITPDISVACNSAKKAHKIATIKRAKLLEDEMSVGIMGDDTLTTNLLSEDAMDEMVDALVHSVDPNIGIDENGVASHEAFCKRMDPEAQKLKNILKQPLYKGARVGKLRVLLGILNLQTTFGWSNTSVDALLSFLCNILPSEENVMPKSHAEAKKTLSSVGLDYDVIHACPKDCILFRGEYAHCMECPKCNSPRFRSDMLTAKVPCKVLRHFPLSPRIRHMFRCKEMSSLMSWWKKNRSCDDIMRGPFDSDAWKHIESTYPDFAMEERNLHFGLATDGVNPFGLKSTTWSTWPVVLVNYNIPPWLATKKGHLVLSALIPGKHKVKNMNVYLQPIVDELKMLWEHGIDVIDASKGQSSAKYFKLRGILMWTMHDYPGLGECASFSVSGYNACPMHCGPNLPKPRWSHAFHKMVYEGHNKYRSQMDVAATSSGAGKRKDVDDAIRPPSRVTARDWRIEWDKCVEEGIDPPRGMKHLSVFYNLPYWESLLICHLLDPMHIFKNVACAIWDHIMGKKDDIKWRMDLEAEKKRPDLWFVENVPSQRAPWVLSSEDKMLVRDVIRNFRMPTGTMHSLRGAFTTRDEMLGLKSHDWHKMLAFILPVAIRQCSSLSEAVKECIYGIGHLVRWISSKEIHRGSIEEHRRKSIDLLCLIEDVFPASVLDIQTHLLIHLADEVQAAGTVHSRWMFYLERFMKTLKGFVRQKSRPEGSMAEGWLVHESCVYVTEFMSRMRDVKFNEVDTPLLWSQKEDARMISNVPQGKGVRKRMSETMRINILNFCYMNCEGLEAWRKEYEEERGMIKDANAKWKSENRGKRNVQCPRELVVPPMAMSQEWFYNALEKAQQDGHDISEELWEYARGPDWFYKSYNALWSHGKHFRIAASDHMRLTFDSGVMADFMQHATDAEEGTERYPYCGTINDIMEVNFRRFTVFLFDVKWYMVKPRNPRATVRWDKNGFYAIDTSKLWPNKNDTLVFPALCEQVVFQPCTTLKSSQWHYVIEIAPRSVRKFYIEEELEDVVHDGPLPFILINEDECAKDDSTEDDTIDVMPDVDIGGSHIFGDDDLCIDLCIELGDMLADDAC